MKTNQKGFSAVEVILVLVIVGLVAGFGWYVWQSKNKDDSKTANTTSNESSTSESGKSLAITALGIKVNDPEGRDLQMHAEKICAAECDTEDSYFIRDDNDGYFERCEYPAVVSKVSEDSVHYITEDANYATEHHIKKIGDSYYQVALGHFQAPCDNLQDGDEDYEDGIRQYILDNMVAE